MHSVCISQQRELRRWHATTAAGMPTMAAGMPTMAAGMPTMAAGTEADGTYPSILQLRAANEARRHQCQVACDNLVLADEGVI